MRDVFPGCKSYSGQDSGSQWGDICAATIATFDKNQTLPKNIGSAVHPIYYFEPPPSGCKPSAYVLYVPPTGMLPIAATHGRYEYFLFQYLREQMNIAVFVLQVPEAGSDLWDHVPPHATGSPYAYDCAKIKSDYDYCFPTCDMCMRNRSTDIIDAAIDTAHLLGYTEQIVDLEFRQQNARADVHRLLYILKVPLLYVHFVHQSRKCTIRVTSVLDLETFL